MTGRFSPGLAQRVSASFPVSIADALGALTAADSAHERRDRVVEVFRASLRFLAAVALAVRVQYGARGEDSKAVKELLLQLRRRGLTDGQWLELCRELVTSGDAQTYPLPALAALFLERRHAQFRVAVDQLLAMRKAETVAHGSTKDQDELEAILELRLPLLEQLLESLEPLWQSAMLVVPLAHPTSEGDPQFAWSLMRETPARGKWPRHPLAAGVRLPPGQPVLVDREWRPILAMSPVTLFRRPSPDATEELFFLDGSKKGSAFFVALPSMAEHLEYDVWADLARNLLPNATAEAEMVEGIDRPYRGLESFERRHAPLYFGRSEQALALANRIRSHSFVTITGPSGSGKTSLLQAGVLPHLESMRPIVVRPGPDPLPLLARALENAKDGPMLLIVDQAEEIFTLAEEEARVPFAEALARASSLLNVHVVFSIREDFFGRVAGLAPIAPIYARTVEVLATPGERDLREVVSAPVRLFGYAFEDPSLIDRIVRPVLGEPAALAMIQFCCDQLWERRDRTWKRLTHDAYDAIGGVAGALASHAEAVCAAFTPSQLAIARSLLLRLVTPERTRAVVAKQDLFEGALDRAEWAVVLDRLIDARLIHAREGEDGRSLVEVVHEALIQQWTRLDGWLEEDRDFVRVRQRLAQAADRWDAENRTADLALSQGKLLAEAESLARERPDALRAIDRLFLEASRLRRDRLRRLERAAVGLVIAFGICATAFGVIALREKQRADARLRTVEAQALTVRSIAAAEVDPGEALELAIRAVETESTPEAVTQLQAVLAGTRFIGVAATMDEPIVSLLKGAGDELVFITSAGKVTRLEVGKEPELLLDCEAQPVAVAQSDDRRSLAVLTAEGDLHLWPGKSKISGAEGTALALDATGSRIAIGDRAGRIQLLDRGGAPIRELPAHRSAVMRVLFLDDGALLTASEDGIVRRIQPDGAVTTEMRVTTATLAALALHEDLVVAGDEAGGLTVASLRSGVRGRVRAHEAPVESIALGPGGEIVTGSADTTARRWSAGLEPRGTLRGHAGEVAVGFLQTGRILLTQSRGELRLWSAQGRPLATFGGPGHPVIACQLAAKDQELVTASAAGTIWRWSLERIGSFKDAFFDHLDRLVTRSSEGEVEVWGPAGPEKVDAECDRLLPAPVGFTCETKAGVEVFEGKARKARIPLDGEDGSAWSKAQISADGDRLLLHGWNGARWRSSTTDLVWTSTVQVMDARSTTDGELALLFGHDEVLRFVRWPGELVLQQKVKEGEKIALDPKGAWFATATSGGEVSSWSSNQPEPELVGHLDERPVAMAITRTGALMAAGSGGAVLVKLSEGGTLRWTASVEVESAVIDDAARSIALIHADGSLGLWSVEGQERWLVRGRSDPIRSAMFSSDGKTLSTISWGGTLALHDVDPESALARARERVVAFDPASRTRP